MSEHRATISWTLAGDDFSYDHYNREHRWRFDDDVEVPASAAPDFLGKAGNVDPEAALVAALSSCHMLTFLAICARRRLKVSAYRDQALGWLEKNDQGQLAVTRVRLSPRVTFDGDAPDAEAFEALHERAHANCFIANSVTTAIEIQAEMVSTGS